MTREELQERIEDILDGIVDDAYRDDHESVHEIAKRILALIPPQPKLEWRELDLFLGDLSVGEIDGWRRPNEEFLASTNDVYAYRGPDIAAAKAAVEDAVRKALGWTND